MVLKDCNSPFIVDDIEHEEYKVLLLRASMDPDNFDSGLEICIAHRNLLGKNFNRFVPQDMCLHNGHLDSQYKRGSKDLHYGTKINYHEALASHKKDGLKLPMGMQICIPCYKYVTESILGTESTDLKKPVEVWTPESSEDTTKNDKDWKSDDERMDESDSLNLEKLSLTPVETIRNTPPITRANAILQAQSMPQGELMPEQQQPMQSEQAQPTLQPELFDQLTPDPPAPPSALLVDHLNTLMEAAGVKPLFPKRQRFRKVQYETCKDPDRKRKVLRAMARAVKAILKTASETEDDLIEMWNDLKDSGLIEDELCVDPSMSIELQEIVLAYNRAPDYPTRTQILCYVVMSYKFCELDRFNEKSEASQDDQEDAEIDISKIETAGLHWDPPLSLRIYNNAKDHYKNSTTHGALEPVIRQPTVKWKFSLECVDMILAYVMHPSITQNMAYGTRKVHNPHGGNSTIANISRKFEDSPLARQIEDHLVAQGVPEPHPCNRTIRTMLQNMPASKTKSLEVIFL